MEGEETVNGIKIKKLCLSDISSTIESSDLSEKPSEDGLEESKATEEERTVCKFYLENRCRFGENCHNFHPADKAPKSPQLNHKYKQSSKQNKKGRVIEDIPISPKKPSMKTVEHVISRLLWDDTLPEENFSIGYLDRFRGILEKPFTFFSWEDIASVDNYVLAIPKHRIQYFKYRGSKVWDKNERLDYMFGSTGSEGSIYDAMKKIDDRLLEEPEMEPEIEPETPSNLNGYEYDDFEKTSGTNDKIHPSHFICCRITDPDIIKTAHIIKEYVERHEPIYKTYFIPDSALHVTIALMKLDQAELPSAVEVFNEMCSELEKTKEMPLSINIDGLDTFGRRILFGKISPHQEFNAFAERSIESLEKSGIRVVAHNNGFNPHLTLWKSARTLARDKRYIDPLLFQNFAGSHFGVQQINNLQFCSVGEEKCDDGFYKCVVSKTF